MMHLFIGGIRDGDWLNVPSDRDFWNVRERLKPLPSPLVLGEYVVPTYHQTMCYARMFFRGEKEKYSLFVAPGLSPDRVLSRLIAGYRGSGEDCE